MSRLVALFVKDDPRAEKAARSFTLWLKEQGVSVMPVSLVSGKPVPCCKAPLDVDFVFVLGGDGSFLSAARWVGDLEIPLLGVKFGEVGFLSEIVEDRLYETARAVLDGSFSAEKRMQLKVSLIRDGELFLEERVLNDVVISKKALARLARIRTEIDGAYLTTYTGDGLIVATPTGSTAYSMAAGGPVVHPSIAAVLLTPICPFTLTTRPLILPDGALIKLSLDSRSSDELMLTCDGQAGYRLKEGDSIFISRAESFVNMITLPDQLYFDVLKAKFRWGGERI